VSQVTLARTKACIFWTTIPATIADTSATRVLHLEPGRASGRSDTSSPSASTRCPYPSLQAWRNTISPSSCFCINATVGSTGVADTQMGQEPPLPEPLAVAGCALFPPGPSITASAPLWEAHTAFVFLRGQPPGNRNKWWRQFWRRVFDYQPVLMRRRDGRQRCHRTCEVLSSNVSARRSAFICGCSNEGMHVCRVPKLPSYDDRQPDG
jgi:hypothetical protein